MVPVIRWLECVVVADFTRAESVMDGRRLSAAFVADSEAGVYLVEMRLNTFFHFIRHAGEFNSHPDPGIASANYSGRREFVIADPEVYAKGGADRQGHDGLHITSVTADVGCVHAQRSV